jgi:hypothetical protein
MGQIMAMAFHDPKELDNVLKPTVRETIKRAQIDPGEWDQDEWWNANG